MIISNSNGTIKKTYFDNKIYNTDGVLIPDFSVVVPNIIMSAIVEKPHILTTLAPHNLQAGDDINTIGDDNIKRSNIVKYVGTNSIELEEAIKPHNSASVNIEVNYYLITFNNISNGFYKFSDNEGLIITDAWLNLFINYASLKSRYDDLTRNINIKNLNQESVNSVFGDFSSVLDFYRKVDTGQIRELIFRKMLCIVIKDYDKKKLACDSYDKLLKEVLLIVSSTPDNGTDPDPTDPNSGDFNPYDITIKYGEK